MIFRDAQNMKDLFENKKNTCDGLPSFASFSVKGLGDPRIVRISLASMKGRPQTDLIKYVLMPYPATVKSFKLAIHRIKSAFCAKVC